MGKFELKYKQLNSAQKQAVDCIDGPVLVIAGPGTGKTELLSMRVANIIRSTDTDPSNILCLTFTNKAAINMRQRIINLTDGEASHVTVKTFHSFAIEIMDIFPEYFWNGAQLTTAPEASQIELITDILKGLPLDNPLALKFSGRFTSEKKVRDALKLVKEAGLTPEQLRNIINANLIYIDLIEEQLCKILERPLSNKKLQDLIDDLEQLPDQGIGNSLLPLNDLGRTIKDKLKFAVQQDQETSKTFHTGALKKKLRTKIDEKSVMYNERKANKWWLLLADVYESYRKKLHAIGYYDHSDMIIEVISALQKHSDLKALAQEKYQYVLIDEFQDTNSAQLQLAHYIADSPDSNGNPNLMVVGDDDQTIYKFNGADLNNMLAFETTYTKTKKIVLTENYRSTQTIIDAADSIIKNAEDRLVNRDRSIVKDLHSNAEDQKTKLQSLIFNTQDDQYHFIAEEINKYRKNNDGTIAILARKHQSLKQISGYLNNRNIPINYEQNNNVFENPIVLLIYKIAGLTVAINNGDVKKSNYFISEILKYPAWEIDAKELWRMAVDNYYKSNWLSYMQDSDNQNIKALGEWFLWLSIESNTRSLPEIIACVLGLCDSKNFTSPIKNYYLKNTPNTEYFKSLSAINIIYGLSKEYAKLSNANFSDFYSYIKLSLENNLSISDESVFNNGNNAVQLLTVHKAKGLEFDRVYIVDAIDKTWKPKSNRNITPINLPLQPVFDDQDDYARLMYVAATRAKQDLIFSSYTFESSDKELLTTPLIYNVIEQKKVNIKDLIVQQNILETTIFWPELNTDNIKHLLKPKLENFSLSVSGLLSFLDLSYGGPKSFLESYLLNLPQVQSEFEAFGSAIHKALEIAQLQVNTDSLNIEQVIEAYSKCLQEQYISSAELIRYQKKGQELIQKLFDQEFVKLQKGSKPEFSVSHVQIGNANIKGKLDRIDEDEDSITIVDYKTGNPLSSLFTKDKSKAIKVWRHKSQLIFYALLVDNKLNIKNAKKVSGQMHYLEADTQKEVIREYIPTEQDKQRMSKLIIAVWNKIINLDFPDISGYSGSFDDIYKFEQDLIDGKI